MKFEEIFDNDGDYKTDSFSEGTCFRITKGELRVVSYADRDEIMPSTIPLHIYGTLFKKNYHRVYTRQELFNK